ncbi:uncharacterized protein LOC132047819 [Lycium ferocissimum]|uniref:uncharacterized protein LOC132047819 n=1 Tax=Lycium ferocissimum TaxID=112874 RepID=UPI0028150B84|nr:uncharacterized protein LOC132047819 [Lycium ferocissimum]
MDGLLIQLSIWVGLINDSRFAALHSDPRFREPPQKKSKVTIDSRFNRMFTDKNFTSSKAPTDIRGKPRNKSSSNNPLNHYYHIQEEEQAAEEEDGEKHKRQKEKSKPITSPLIKKINANLGKSDEEVITYTSFVLCSRYHYKTCDGVEFERTSNKLDLRFIPDSMEFKHQPRDIATEAPADYEGLDFHTRALQHSNIELTWDEDEPQHIRTLKRQFNDEQLADLELKEFLASDESESDASEEGDDREAKSAKRKKKQDTYRASLQSGEGSDGNDEEDDQDMEVTFNTGLEDLSKRILEKKDKQSETVWEAYLRKKKEKKKSRKGNSKDSSEDESSDSDQEPIDESEDFFIDEPSANQDKSTRKGRQSLEASEEAEASRAELELLLADDKAGDANLKGYNMKPKRSWIVFSPNTTVWKSACSYMDYFSPQYNSGSQFAHALSISSDTRATTSHRLRLKNSPSVLSMSLMGCKT